MIEDERQVEPRRCRSRSATSTTSRTSRRAGFRPSALRYLYLGVHYRKQLKFSWAAMAQAEEALKRLTDFLARLDTLPERDANPAVATQAATRRPRPSHEHITDRREHGRGARRACSTSCAR